MIDKSEHTWKCVEIVYFGHLIEELFQSKEALFGSIFGNQNLGHAPKIKADQKKNKKICLKFAQSIKNGFDNSVR